MTQSPMVFPSLFEATVLTVAYKLYCVGFLSLSLSDLIPCTSLSLVTWDTSLGGAI